ncbi:hypothetical protein A2783_05790 [Microgenomates group bacterium RIFCSPHIGHO2_01_FULL_45_11]|nr:MAG: hypothetical protein A2783_05790 [Microgenomates group bacterium RIFCSPHIGHO2_01_FULL_45_11]
MKKVKLFSSLLTTGYLLLATAPAAFAQNIGVPKPQNFKIDQIGTLISGAVGIALLIAAILVFAYLVYGGIAYITSGGDKTKTEEARNRISSALVGLAIVASAWAIIKLIEFFFGITIFGTDVTIPKGY